MYTAFFPPGGLLVTARKAPWRGGCRAVILKRFPFEHRQQPSRTPQLRNCSSSGRTASLPEVRQATARYPVFIRCNMQSKCRQLPAITRRGSRPHQFHFCFSVSPKNKTKTFALETRSYLLVILAMEVTGSLLFKSHLPFAVSGRQTTYQRDGIDFRLPDSGKFNNFITAVSHPA